MRYLENISDWLDKNYGKKERLEDQFLDKIVDGMNADLEEVSKLWMHILIFKCAIVDELLGMENRRDDLIREFEWRIVEGEDPKKVSIDIYNKLPKTTEKLESAYLRIFNGGENEN